MIDADGFRPNVGIVLSNDAGQVLWARRVGQSAWQFPQGGIDTGESPEQALFRELEEEVGLKETSVEVLGSTRGWLKYRLPDQYRRRDSEARFIGQKQKWFLLRVKVSDEEVCLHHGDKPEFDQWGWVSYWYPLSQVIEFKKHVYRKALAELAPLVNITGAGSGSAISGASVVTGSSPGNGPIDYA